MATTDPARPKAAAKTPAERDEQLRRATGRDLPPSGRKRPPQPPPDEPVTAVHPSVGFDAATAPNVDEPVFEFTSERPAESESPAPDVGPKPADAPAESATAHDHFCPHCGGDTRTDDSTIADVDKATFVVCLVGRRPFVKEYALLGGRVALRFREIHPGENEEIVRQLARDRADRQILTEAQEVEWWGRYRVALQLLEYRAEGEEAISLAEGLSPRTSPCARTFWPPADGKPTAEMSLRDIERYVRTTVLRTESIYALARMTMNEFNRLAARLAVRSKDPDFLVGTG